MTFALNHHSISSALNSLYSCSEHRTLKICYDCVLVQLFKTFKSSQEQISAVLEEIYLNNLFLKTHHLEFTINK